MDQALQVSEPVETPAALIAKDGGCDIAVNQVRATANAGRFVAKEGAHEYAVGLMTEQTELIRSAQRRLVKFLKADDAAPPDRKIKLHERLKIEQAIAKNATVIGQNIQKLQISADRVGQRNKEESKVRSPSFKPGQKLTIVDVQSEKPKEEAV